MDKLYKGVLLVRLLHQTTPTLLTLRRAHTISSSSLAKATGTSLRASSLVEIGGTVSQEVATNVLTAFSELTGKTNSLQDIDASVRKENQQ